MNITRKVVMDLIPLYAANELSEDSRQIVEEFLKTDPELAELVKKLAANGLRSTPPEPSSRDAELRSFIQAKKLMLLRTAIWIFGAAFLAAVVFMFIGRIR